MIVQKKHAWQNPRLRPADKKCLINFFREFLISGGFLYSAPSIKSRWRDRAQIDRRFLKAQR